MKRVFLILAISTFSSMLGMGIIAPLLPLYAESLGASGVWIGIVFAGFSISRTIFMPIVGNISDRIGRRIFICAGLFAYAVISLGYVWANQVSELTFVRVIHGVASAMVIPIAQAYIGELSPEGKEGTWMGSFNAAFYAGFGFGPLIGGVLTEYFSMEAAFYTMGALSLLAFLLALFLLPEIHQLKKSIQDPPPFFSWMRKSSVMKGLLSYQFVYAAGRSVFMSFLPLFGAFYLALSPAQTGAIVAIYILLMSISQLFLGRIADVFNRKGLIIVGSLISLSFLALVPEMHSFWQLLALCIIGGIGNALPVPAASALSVEEGRKYGMGSTMGAFNMGNGMGMAVGPLVAGVILDFWNINSVFYFGAIMGLLGTILFIWFTR